MTTTQPTRPSALAADALAAAFAAFGVTFTDIDSEAPGYVDHLLLLVMDTVAADGESYEDAARSIADAYLDGEV